MNLATPAECADWLESWDTGTDGLWFSQTIAHLRRLPAVESGLPKLRAESVALAQEADAKIAQLERRIKQRDRLSDSSRKFWCRAAKAAMAGDFRELRNRVAMAESAPIAVVPSDVDASSSPPQRIERPSEDQARMNTLSNFGDPR